MKEIKKYIDELIEGTKIMFKELFSKETSKKQIANLVTFSRLVLAPIVVLLLGLGIPLAAFGVAILGCATDWVDGTIARKTDSVSKYGERLDQVVDKIFYLLIGISLSIFNPLFIVNLVGEGLIGTTNILYQTNHKDIKVESSKMGKFKQWPLSVSFGLGFLAIQFPALIPIVNGAILATFGTQVLTIADYININNKKINHSSSKAFQNELLNSFKESDIENIKVLEKESKSSTEQMTTQQKLNELYRLRDEYTDTSDVILYDENDFQKTKKK